MSRMHNAALWDLDGTILDSHEYHWLSWHEAMAAEGIGLARPQFEALFGRCNDITLRAWLGPDAAEADIVRIAEDKEVRYRRLVRTRGIELLPGVEVWLKRLRAAGWRQALATSAPRANVDAILETLGIGHYFAAMITAEDVTRGKPDPDVFLAAARAVAAPVYRCVVIEDSPAGIEAARRARMRCIGVGPHHAALPADLTTPSLVALNEDAFDWVLALEM